ncbi:DNA/RNA non-specific endonuclease [Amycolatopsis australiensis]|uniref:DNA/RNA non-specific endonuclease n=1 Tax=Amycolatopsis australiensis TaxID=546364 RepID=A0A1K1S378_9PSEU|nr:DNA/RNA non-specific endonuclease [Amycolatopsis australiensis]SFW78766.1 DNA/RNA non-specific endonuclease [Amycolatopsis australiensis]
MPEGNPLVAEAKQDPNGPGPLTAGNGDYGWAGGIGIAESSMDAFNGIKDGDWVSGGLGMLSLAGEIAGAAVDPFGYLMSSVASFLMEHVQPLKDMLDSVAGNPPVIQSYADTWGNVSKALAERKTDFDNAVKNGTTGWSGEGAEAYRKFAAEHSEALSGAATVAGAISTVTMIMGQVVSFVRETVRQLIADLVGKLISWVMEEVFSLGFGTPVVVAQASAAIAKWGKKIGDLLKKLTDTIRKVSPLLSKLVDVFEKIAKVFGKVLGKVSGLDGLHVKEGGFVRKIPKGEGGGVHARAHGGEGAGGERSHGGEPEDGSSGARSSDGDAPEGAPSRAADDAPSGAGDSSPSHAGEGAPSRAGESAPSRAGDSSPARSGDDTPAHAGDGAPAHTADSSGSHATNSSPSRAADSGPSHVAESGPSRAADSGPSHVAESGPSRAADSSPSHVAESGPSRAADSSPSPTRAGDSAPSHAADSAPSRAGDSAPSRAADSPATRAGDGTPSHATDSTPTRSGDGAPAHAADSAAARAGDSVPSRVAESGPAPTRAGDSGPGPGGGSPGHGDGGGPAHSAPSGRADAPGLHADGETPSSAAPPRTDGATTASGTAPAAPRTGEPGTFPAPRGADVPPQGGAPMMGGGMPPGGTPAGGGLGGGTPRTGGGASRTGTPGAHAPDTPGRPRTPDTPSRTGASDGRPRTGGPETPRPRTPDAPAPAARGGYGPAGSTHAPDTRPGGHGPGTRPGGPGHTGPGRPHGTDSPHESGVHNNGPHESGAHNNGPHSNGPHRNTPREDAAHENGPRSNTPREDAAHENGPHSNTPRENAPHENAPHDNPSHEHTHHDPEPLTPDEINTRHAESTPSGSSYHAGDPDMGDLPHRVHPDPDGRYTVDVHVTPDGHARIGDRLYTPEQFADILRRNADYDGRPIRLIGCDAGSNDFAHRLSRELNTEVMAPTKPAWTDSHGRVFSSDYEIGPDGKMRPRIPPDGEWAVHRPDGSTHAAGEHGFAPGTDHHDVDAGSARHRGDDDNPRQRDAPPPDADPDNPRRRHAPPPDADPDAQPRVPKDRNPLSQRQEQELTDPQRQLETRRNPQHGADFAPAGGEHVPMGPGSTHPDAPRPPHPHERFPTDQKLLPHRSYQVVDSQGRPRGTYHTDASGRVTHIDTAHPNVPPRIKVKGQPGYQPNPAYHPNPDVLRPHANTTYRVEIDGHHQTFQTDADGVPHPSVRFHRPDFEGDPVTIDRTHPSAPPPGKSFAEGGPYEPHTRYEVTGKDGVPRGTFYTDAEGHVRWADVESGRIGRTNPDWKAINDPRLVPPGAEVRVRQRIDPGAPVPDVENPERFRGARRHDVKLAKDESFLDSVPKNADGRPKLEPNSKYVVESDYGTKKKADPHARSVFWTDEHGNVAVVETFRPHNPELNNPSPNMVYRVDDGRFEYQTGPGSHGDTDTVHGRSNNPALADSGELPRRDPKAQELSGQQGPGGVYDGGHIAGNQFRGPGELLNMLAQWRPQNQGWKVVGRGDSWLGFEMDLADHLRKGGRIEGIDVFPLRHDGDPVPHTIQVRWVELDAAGRPIVHLRSFGNIVPAT